MKMSRTQKVLFIILAAAIVICTGAIIWLSVLSNTADRFTEFYILNSQGKASGYPTDVKTGELVTVILGVVNHEGRTAEYSIRVISDNKTIQTVELAAADGATWENTFTFTLGQAGQNQRVEFYLYMSGENTPHIKDPLVLALNVSR